MNIRKWSRHAGLLLMAGTALILLFSLIGFGAAHQGRESDTMLAIPNLWTSGLLLLPILFYVITGWVWQRFDRIVR